MRIITQYFQDSSEERQEEIDMCVRKNIENPHIARVHLLLEKEMDLSRFDQDGIRTHIIGRRLRYTDAFDYANTKLAGRLCAVANVDIYFDESLAHLKTASLSNKCLALTRYNLDDDDRLVFHGQCNSQDVWIFRAPLPNVFGNFYLGKPGCDNRIAYELKKAGLKLSNPFKKIITVHVHRTGKRNYDSAKETVPGPYAEVPFTEDI